MDSTELVQRAIEGDRDAFGELVRRHERLVLGVAWNLLRDYHVAQDVAQEAFVTAFQRLSDLQNPAVFGAWVVQIAVRCCHRVRNARSLVPLPTGHDQAHESPEYLLINEESDRVLSAIQRLPEHEQTIVFLRYVDGHEVATIARLTQRPVGTVTKQLSRAVQRLRNFLVEVQP